MTIAVNKRCFLEILFAVFDRGIPKLVARDLMLINLHGNGGVIGVSVEGDTPAYLGG
jgi:hypothetical protein